MPVTGKRRRNGHRLGLNCSGESGCSGVLRPIFFARGSGSTGVIRELFGFFRASGCTGPGLGPGFGPGFLQLARGFYEQLFGFIPGAAPGFRKKCECRTIIAARKSSI